MQLGHVVGLDGQNLVLARRGLAVAGAQAVPLPPAQLPAGSGVDQTPISVKLTHLEVALVALAPVATLVVPVYIEDSGTGRIEVAVVDSLQGALSVYELVIVGHAMDGAAEFAEPALVAGQIEVVVRPAGSVVVAEWLGLVVAERVERED